MFGKIIGALFLILFYLIPFVALYLVCNIGKKSSVYFNVFLVATLGLSGIIWEFTLFFGYYQDSIVHGAWTAASMTIGLAPFFSIVTGFIVGLMGLGLGFILYPFINKDSGKKKLSLMSLAGLILILISIFLIFNKLTHARNHTQTNLEKQSNMQL